MASSKSISWSHYAFMQPEFVWCLRCSAPMGIRAPDRAGAIDPLCTQCHINEPPPGWRHPNWTKAKKKASK